MQFIVITGVPAQPDIGNLAMALGSLFHEDGRPVETMAALSLRIPVFTLGEIIIADESGREIIGAGRKPSKWSVETESFSTINQAITRSTQITNSYSEA